MLTLGVDALVDRAGIAVVAIIRPAILGALDDLDQVEQMAVMNARVHEI